MAEAIRLPRMSDTMEEGVVADIIVKVGDTVKTGDVIAEVETDKATMEWESYQAGTVLYIAVQKGDTVPVDSLFAILGKKGEDYQAILDEEKTRLVTASTETEEVSPKLEAPSASPAAQAVQPVALQVMEPATTLQPGGNGMRLKASPLAKKIAAENNIDLKMLRGTGDDGRIVKRDIEVFMKEHPVGTQFIPPVIAGRESFREEAISQMRKTIAKRLAESKFGAPHFYLTMEINMDKAIEAREGMNEVSPVKISFNDIIIKAVASALRQHPKVNTSWLGDRIRYNDHIHIGMAVAVDEGLLVPVIRFAESKPLSHISAEAKTLAEKARDRKLSLEEMQGNTFTISNLGMLGIEEFTAVINPPDACIMAVGTIKQVPVLENGELRNTNVMKVTLSCDHRVVDGATGSQFLQTFKANMEDPVRMLV